MLFQAFFINLLVEAVLDVAVKAAKEAVEETDNDIDDAFVATLETNKKKIAQKIKGN